MMYEVVLHAVEADSPEEAVLRAKENATVDHYEYSNDELHYEPEVMSEEDLKYYDDENIIE